MYKHRPAVYNFKKGLRNVLESGDMQGCLCTLDISLSAHSNLFCLMKGEYTVKEIQYKTRGRDSTGYSLIKLFQQSPFIKKIF